jgi:putative membrane protein
MRSIKSVVLTVGVLALVAAAVATAGLAAGKHHGPRPSAHHSTKKGDETSRERGKRGDEQGEDEQGEEGHRGVCKRHRGVCGLDVYWLRSSIQGDVFEIRGGQLALQKSSNTAVRTLGQRLITDHTKSLQDALDLAKKYGISVKTEPTQTQQWQLEELSELSGAAFNHDYAQLEVADHQQDIEDAQSEVQMGCNKDIREDAANEIPTLQQHLQLAQQALSTTSED